MGRDVCGEKLLAAWPHPSFCLAPLVSFCVARGPPRPQPRLLPCIYKTRIFSPRQSSGVTCSLSFSTSFKELNFIGSGAVTAYEIFSRTDNQRLGGFRIHAALYLCSPFSLSRSRHVSCQAKLREKKRGKKIKSVIRL